MKRPANYRETAESPARNSYAVTPHDTNEIGEFIPKAIWVGTGGNLTLRLLGDTSDTLIAGVPNGSWLPIVPRIIKSTGTTASGIVAFY